MSDPSPILAMRAGLGALFAADAALGALMGGTVRLYDEPPRGAKPVYAMFGDAEVVDDSVDGAQRHRHTHRLVVFARPGSTRTGLDAAARMAALVAGAAPPLPGHVLVRLNVQSVSVRRDESTGEARAVLVLDAVTEAA